ncbi:hypothetical protein LINPERPRIM_LOCUS14159 [Linum perenne]
MGPHTPYFHQLPILPPRFSPATALNFFFFFILRRLRHHGLTSRRPHSPHSKLITLSTTKKALTFTILCPSNSRRSGIDERFGRFSIRGTTPNLQVKKRGGLKHVDEKTDDVAELGDVASKESRLLRKVVVKK